MKSIMMAAALAGIAAPAAPALSQTRSERQYQQEMRQYERDVAAYERQQRRYNRQNRNWRQWRGYDYNRFEPGQDRYYADRYYRSGTYAPRRLRDDDRIYRGNDGRYYCRRTDGTTGLIIGGIAGGLLGSAIARGDSNTLGALIGAAGGALAGRAIERDRVTCR